jgi:hypothetical protein
MGLLNKQRLQEIEQSPSVVKIEEYGATVCNMQTDGTHRNTLPIILKATDRQAEGTGGDR